MVSKDDLLASNIRPLYEYDLEMVLEWRNHISVRGCMETQHIIKLEEHKQWFESISDNASKECLIFEYKKIPQGFISFSQLKQARVADWGFYMSPLAEKGIGRILGFTALKYAFEERNFHKVCGQVIGFNERSIAFHKRLGFVEEGCLREQYFMGKSFYSMKLFGLLKTEWDKIYREVK